MKKTVILMMCNYYLPGYKAGGAPKSEANIIEHLGDRFSFRVITRDRDMGDAVPYPDRPAETWMPVGKAEVMYLAPWQFNFCVLSRILRQTEYDVLRLTSFFSPRTTILPLLMRRLGVLPDRPVVLAPHGEFSPAALRLKWPKKRAYLLAAKAIDLYGGLIWQASSEAEEQDIRRCFGKKIRVEVARNLPTLFEESVSGREPCAKTPGSLKIAFVSRINRKKNLDGALRMLQGLEGRIEFHIFGPQEDPPYWNECRRLIETLPPNVRVVDHGLVPAETVVAHFSQHHLFLFPTHGENFGHVILESLLAGCPVLASDQTFFRGLEDEGAGWDLPLDRPESFHAALRRCVAMDNAEFREMSRRARHFGEAVANDPQAVEQNIRLFQVASSYTRAAA